MHTYISLYIYVLQECCKSVASLCMSRVLHLVSCASSLATLASSLATPYLFSSILQDSLVLMQEFLRVFTPKSCLSSHSLSQTSHSLSHTHPHQVAELFGTEVFRVFTSKDVVGVEIGGAVKNVIAIAAGMAEVCIYCIYVFT